MELSNRSDQFNNQENNSFIFPKLSVSELSVITSLYVLLILISLIGNGLILTAFTVNKKLRTVTNTLVMGLAVSDILVGLVSIPCWMYIYLSIYHDYPVKKNVAGFYRAFDIFVGSASILQLTCISMERCHAVVKPLQHRTLPKRIFYAMIAVAWFYACVMGLLHPLQLENWQEVYTILVFTTCFFIPFAIIFVAYICIYRATRKPCLIQRHAAVGPRNLLKKELRLSITLALITTIFVISWLPVFLVTVIATYSKGSIAPGVGTDRLVKFVKWMHYSNSAINPYVYSYRNTEITRTLRFILCRVFCRNSESAPLRGIYRAQVQHPDGDAKVPEAGTTKAQKKELLIK